MRVVEAIKRGGSVFKDVLPPMAVICVFNFISAFVMLMIIGVNPTPDKIARVSGPMVLVFLLMMTAWIFIEGGVFSSVMSFLKTGSLNMGEFMGNCTKYFLRLLGINVIGGLITILFWLVGAFLTGVFVALGGGNNIFFNIIGGIVLLMTLLGVAVVAMPLLISQYFTVINNIGVRDSLGKGFSFIKKYFWKTAGFFLLLAVCVFAVTFAANIISSLLGTAIKGMGAAVISIILTSLANGAIGVFSAACIMTYVLGILQSEEPPAVAAAETKE